MFQSSFSLSIIYSIIVTIITVSLFNVSLAQVRSSSNYQLQSDSINIGGGFSSSTSYIQESTIGEIATGQSTSATYSLRAGYQQMQEVYLSLSTTGDVTMDTDLPGLTGGISNGSTTFTVITDSPSGYQLTIEAENSPAMQSGANSISDYTPASSIPDFSFTTTGPESHLGFSPEGVDLVQRWLNSVGNVCNTGSLDTSLSCWDGLSTSPAVMAVGAGSNHPSGATTTVNFRVGIGSNAGVIAGVYTATTTVTALPL